MNEMLFWQILLVIGYVWVFIYGIKDAIETQQIIHDNARLIGKTKKQKQYIFVNEEDTAFAMSIDMLEEENDVYPIQR